MERDTYNNPLITRYASKEMASIFSDNFKYRTWRKLWLALAKVQKELGICISGEQICDLEKNIDNIDYEFVKQVEEKKKHDVIAHIDAYAKTAPLASGIIHYGATSAFVTDNTDLIQIRDAGRLIYEKLLMLIKQLKDKAIKYKDLPILGFTHFQVAQPTTVGKRFCLWLYDLYEDACDLEKALKDLKFRGAKGTIGSMASYFEIFSRDLKKCLELDERIAKEFGFRGSFPVTGQVYPRKTDYKISSILSQIAQSMIKMSTDIRLLQHRGEVSEPFSPDQIGSSAMPYKQNPMRSERITGLARYLISKPVDFANVSSSQWLERSLDDSAIRRIIIPEAFLTADAIISLGTGIIKGIKVNEKVIYKNLTSYMPLLISEKLIARMVADNVPRQKAHHRIRDITIPLIEEGKIDQVPERLFNDELTGRYRDYIRQVSDPLLHTGASGHQVEEFINKSIIPLLEKSNISDHKYEHKI